MYAFEHQSIPDDSIAALIERIVSPQLTTGDMDLTLLVRVLQFVEPSVQTKIATALQTIYDSGELRLWLTDATTTSTKEGEDYNTYWTDNHMILWLSSTWILVRNNNPAAWITVRSDDEAVVQLEQRLRHYLNFHIEYGMYEFMSTNYIVFVVGTYVVCYVCVCFLCVCIDKLTIGVSSLSSTTPHSRIVEPGGLCPGSRHPGACDTTPR